MVGGRSRSPARATPTAVKVEPLSAIATEPAGGTRPPAGAGDRALGGEGSGSHNAGRLPFLAWFPKVREGSLGLAGDATHSLGPNLEAYLYLPPYS